MKELAAIFRELFYSGLESFGKYYSTYRAYVADNNDPDKLGRLKLIIPEVTSNDPYDYWAPAKNQYSGVGYGVHVIPGIGDMVWVEFEQGIPEHPIWMHGHWGESEIPEQQDKDLEDVESFWFMTPKGNIIYINDTKGIINITSADQDEIEINKKAISLKTDKKISLGKKDSSDEPALLGDKTEDTLNKIYDLLKEISNAIIQDVATSQLANQPFLSRGALTSKSATWISALVDIKQSIQKIKSKKVTLD